MNEDFSIKEWEAKKKCRHIIGEEIMELAIKSNGFELMFPLYSCNWNIFRLNNTLLVKVPKLVFALKNST